MICAFGFGALFDTRLLLWCKSVLSSFVVAFVACILPNKLCKLTWTCYLLLYLGSIKNKFWQNEPATMDPAEVTGVWPQLWAQPVEHFSFGDEFYFCHETPFTRSRHALPNLFSSILKPQPAHQYLIHSELRTVLPQSVSLLHSRHSHYRSSCSCFMAGRWHSSRACSTEGHWRCSSYSSSSTVTNCSYTPNSSSGSKAVTTWSSYTPGLSARGILLTSAPALPVNDLFMETGL